MLPLGCNGRRPVGVDVICWADWVESSPWKGAEACEAEMDAFVDGVDMLAAELVEFELDEVSEDNIEVPKMLDEPLGIALDPAAGIGSNRLPPAIAVASSIFNLLIIVW